MGGGTGGVGDNVPLTFGTSGVQGGGTGWRMPMGAALNGIIFDDLE